MREFSIWLWHLCKASQQLVPWQWICKARTEGIIWFSIYSSGQFLQQSILINKLKPCKKNLKASESFLLQQARLRLYGPTQTPRTLLFWKINFTWDLKQTLGFFPNAKTQNPPFKWDPVKKNTRICINSLGLTSSVCYFTLQLCKIGLNMKMGDRDWSRSNSF